MEFYDRFVNHAHRALWFQVYVLPSFKIPRLLREAGKVERSRAHPESLLGVPARVVS